MWGIIEGGGNAMLKENVILYAGVLLGFTFLLAPLVILIYGAIKKKLKLVLKSGLVFLAELIIAHFVHRSGMLFIMAIILCGVIFVGLIPIVPIVILIIGLAKNNNKFVKIGLTVITIEMVLIGGYHFIYPTHYPYVDRWIMGKNEAQIIEKYGVPYEDYMDSIVYKAGQDALFGDPYYYYIFFDEDGKAVNCEIRFEIKGG